MYWFGHELQTIRGTWANQLKHEDDGGWPRITGDKRYWANQLKHEDDGGGQELLAIEGTGQTDV